MINEKITGYVVGERARGVKDDAIRAALLAQGWKPEDITGAMGESQTATSRVAELPELFTLLGLTWKTYTKRFQLYFLIATLPIGVSVIGFIFMGGYTMNYLGASGSNDFSGIEDVGTYLLIGFLQGVASLISGAAVILALKDPSITSPVVAWQRALSVLVSYAVTSVVSGIIIGFGFLLLIIPGVFLMGRYGLAGIISVMENKGVGDSMNTSKLYAADRVWTIAWKLLAGVILISIIGGIISSTLDVAKFFTPILSVILSGIVGAVTAGLVATYMYYLYMHASARM